MTSTPKRQDSKLLAHPGSLLLILSFLFFNCPSLAQSTNKSFKAPCSIQFPGVKPVRFNCRWMYDGDTGGTIFVDNGDTGERYNVNNQEYPRWRVDKIGGKCIVNKMGTKVCRLW
jgi:hypothetical protein